MSQQNASKPPEKLLVFGTVSFYMVAALSMVIANKKVLNGTDVPLFFLLTQLIIAVGLFSCCHALGLLKVPFTIDFELVKGLAPMIILNVIGLSFSNFTLKYVDASFYQIARGMVLPFTVATSFYFLGSRPSTQVLSACALVTCGFLVGVLLDGVNVSLVGIFFGVASSATTALHAVTIKKAMKLLDNSALASCWYMNLLSSIVLGGVVLVSGEVPGIAKLLYGDSEALRTFVWGSCITGVFGFLMGIASLMSIKVTSPITHMVSSAVRGVAASVLGVWYFNDFISTGRASSIAIILGGSMYYTWVKHLESQSPSSPSTEKTYDRVPMDEIEAGRKGEKPE